LRGPSDKRLAIAALIAFSFWIFVALPLYYGPRDDSAANQCSRQEEKNYGFWEKTRCDPVAYFTVWLVVFTGVLAASTIGLWYVTWRISTRQVGDTEILQRAYLSVDPAGIQKFETRDLSNPVVDISNAGNLPAREVSFFCTRETSTNGSRENFPIDEKGFAGNWVISPKVNMRRGIGAFSHQELDTFKKAGGAKDRWIYVWGEVRYKDGFDNWRFTRFCHRYNCAALDTGYEILSRDARVHEFGNDAD